MKYLETEIEIVLAFKNTKQENWLLNIETRDLCVCVS